MRAEPHTHIKIQMWIHRCGPKHWLRTLLSWLVKLYWIICFCATWEPCGKMMNKTGQTLENISLVFTCALWNMREIMRNNMAIYRRETKMQFNLIVDVFNIFAYVGIGSKKKKRVHQYCCKSVLSVLLLITSKHCQKVRPFWKWHGHRRRG